ncbi:MAG: HAD family phosphatase [Clostridia bacterium]|nr:HAD family phosphatase [Clostridia bacterium]
MDKRLIATDFDGTLYIKCEISDFDRNAIDLWRKNGRFFGIVTGRGEDFKDTVKELGLGVDYLILCNGSYIVDGDGNIIYTSPIDGELFKALESAFRAYKDIEYFSEYDGSVRYQFYATFPSVERALGAADELSVKFAGKISAFVNGRHVNVGNAGTGKAESVYIILKHFGLSEDAAAVVGDDYNDLLMIKEHLGWAVRSGVPAVTAQAPNICESVGDLALTLLKKNDSEV